jgi:hypothetical protein
VQCSKNDAEELNDQAKAYDDEWESPTALHQSG